MLLHTGERNVKCIACSKMFCSTSKANLHYRKFHEGQHWQCKYCENKFQTITRFKEHLFVHRGFYPYNCPMCTVHYAEKSVFQRHLMKHHKIEYDAKIHGYVEKENLDALVKECERRNGVGLENNVTEETTAETSFAKEQDDNEHKP